MSEYRTSGSPNRTLFRPVIELSGFRTSGSQLTVRISNARIVFGHSITGRLCPVIGHNRLRELEFKLPDVRNPDNCPDFRRFGTKTGTKTGSKPVWNRFWSSKPVWNRFWSRRRYNCPNTGRPVHIIGVEPDV